MQQDYHDHDQDYDHEPERHHSVFAELLDSPLLLVPATQGQRFLNYVIDVIAFYALCMVLGIVLGVVSVATDSPALVAALDSPLVSLFGILLMVTYYFVLETTTGRTLGKLVTRTRVVMEDGSRPTAGTIMKRSLCRIIPFEGFSFLGGGTGMHDRLSHTLVVKLD